MSGIPPAAPAAGAGRGDCPVLVTDLTVRRGARAVLDAVNLSVAAGEFLAIVGKNGAGKTTLLQAIAGVVPPPRGSVRVAGVDPGRADARQLSARVGFVFQNPEHQFIRSTVQDELAHALQLQGRPPEEVEERVETMLARFGLTRYRAVHPFLLSGGQKRRLSVGTALIGGAEVLALDEPTFGQDRQHAAAIMDLLVQLRGEGTTILMVSHDLQLVAEYADRIAVVDDGRLLAVGPVQEILAGDALVRAGIGLPPLVQALRGLPADSPWRGCDALDHRRPAAGPGARQ